MKVFDFSNGKKGKQVGEIARWTGSHGPGKVGGNFDIGRYDYTTEFFGTENGHEKTFTAKDFGVDAVCFCIGQMTHNDEWSWSYCAPAEWISNHFGAFKVELIIKGAQIKRLKQFRHELQGMRAELEIIQQHHLDKTPQNDRAASKLQEAWEGVFDAEDEVGPHEVILLQS